MILFFFACGGDAANSAGSVSFDATQSGARAATVQGALDELYVKCRPAPEPEAVAAPSTTEMNELAGRVQALELRVAAVEGNLPGPLEGEPMTSSELQRAVADLSKRLGQLETSAATASMGSPGTGLFEIRDTKKKGKAEGSPPPGGAPGGPGGGGGPGGKPSGPPPQGGGGQGGPPGH